MYSLGIVLRQMTQPCACGSTSSPPSTRFHVQKVDCVVVWLQWFVSHVLLVSLVQGVDICKVNCFSTLVTFEAAWYQPIFVGCLVLRKPDMVELFQNANFENLLREEIRLIFGS